MNLEFVFKNLIAFKLSEKERPIRQEEKVMVAASWMGEVK